MSLDEKLEMLKDVMDYEEELRTDMPLEDLEEWDSLSVLALISTMKKKFDVSLSTKQIKEFQTVGDICNIIP